MAEWPGAFEQAVSGTPIRAGRPRRFDRLQSDGLRALNQTRATVDSLWRGLKWPLKGLA